MLKKKTARPALSFDMDEGDGDGEDGEDTIFKVKKSKESRKFKKMRQAPGILSDSVEPSVNKLAPASTVLGGAYSSESLTMLREQQMFAPKETAEVDSKLLPVGEGVELSGEDAEQFVELTERVALKEKYISADRSEESADLEAIYAARLANKALLRGPSDRVYTSATMGKETKTNIDLNQDNDSDWEAEIIRRGVITGKAAFADRGDKHTGTIVASNNDTKTTVAAAATGSTNGATEGIGITVTALIQSVQSAADTLKESENVANRKLELLTADFSKSRLEEAALKKKVDEGVRRLNIIQEIKYYFATLVGMLRDKASAFDELKAATYDGIKERMDLVVQRRIYEQEDAVYRLKESDPSVAYDDAYTPTAILLPVAADNNIQHQQQEQKQDDQLPQQEEKEDKEGGGEAAEVELDEFGRVRHVATAGMGYSKPITAKGYVATTTTAASSAMLSALRLREQKRREDRSEIADAVLRTSEYSFFSDEDLALFVQGRLQDMSTTKYILHQRLPINTVTHTLSTTSSSNSSSSSSSSNAETADPRGISVAASAAAADGKSFCETNVSSRYQQSLDLYELWEENCVLYDSRGVPRDWNRRSETLKQAREAVTVDVDSDILSVETLIQKVAEFSQTYPQEFQSAYIDASVAELLPPLIELDLCSIAERILCPAARKAPTQQTSTNVAEPSKNSSNNDNDNGNDPHHGNYSRNSNDILRIKDRPWYESLQHLSKSLSDNDSSSSSSSASSIVDLTIDNVLKPWIKEVLISSLDTYSSVQCMHICFVLLDVQQLNCARSQMQKQLPLIDETYLEEIFQKQLGQICLLASSSSSSSPTATGRGGRGRAKEEEEEKEEEFEFSCKQMHRLTMHLRNMNYALVLKLVRPKFVHDLIAQFCVSKSHLRWVNLLLSFSMPSSSHEEAHEGNEQIKTSIRMQRVKNYHQIAFQYCSALVDLYQGAQVGTKQHTLRVDTFSSTQQPTLTKLTSSSSPLSSESSTMERGTVVLKAMDAWTAVVRTEENNIVAAGQSLHDDKNGSTSANATYVFLKSLEQYL